MKVRVPKVVRAEAQRGLRWRALYGRGGTSVGLHTARWLETGWMPIWKVKHVLRYFPRHAWERRLWWRGKEPSNGRIAWALWGGDAGWRWAKGVVERSG